MAAHSINFMDGNYSVPGYRELFPQAKPGARIAGARYLLKRMLGRGSCSEVWLARDVQLELDIALKFLPVALFRDVHFVARFEQEAQLAGQLAHPAIARVHRFICENQVAVLVSEFVEGWPVAALKIDRPGKRLRIDEIMPWLRQVCFALEYAHHEFCLVHRALNPWNLLLNARDQLKITDFGLAHLIRCTAAEPGNQLFGTIAYMSPEQIQGAEPSVLDDIYSLGATIYDLVTGTPPFDKGNILAPAERAPAAPMNERLGELGIDESIPPAWEELVSACLARDPGKRPQSASDILRCLELKPAPGVALATVDNESRPSSVSPAQGAGPRAILKKLQSVIGASIWPMFSLAGTFSSALVL